MGNCQAADTAAVVIQHRDGRLEKAYWSLLATQVMADNPGHYVASILTCTSRPSSPASHHHRGKPVEYLKLLRPDETLVVGHVYRLVSFEEVLREFASKRHVRLSRLLDKQEEKASSSTVNDDDRHREMADSETVTVPAKREEHKAEAEVDKQMEEVAQGMKFCCNTPSGGATRQGQWKPALESIAEVGEQARK
ncbi:uncharacterized protein LOC122034824 [Zingiber officinale]|uniref:Uncharacterized protein n=1 Tax=Zingiber officinale TaxID=94328 RepID=A0A8J5ESX0_ZINOF|nr:uncharacterized protein LOC122034824 [Zingiber officinale]KAG6469109.1 hypothetical protein ZIOFF_073807 [Zingiber officinale]